MGGRAWGKGKTRYVEKCNGIREEKERGGG